MRVLSRAKPLENDTKYMVVDIETKEDETYGTALLGEPNYISWCIDGEGFGKQSDNLTAWLISYFLQPKYEGWILYAHNGFRFDFFRINYEWLADLGYNAEFLTGNDGAIKSITVTLGGFVWIIRDTVLLIPMSLDKLTKTFAPEHLKMKRKYSFADKPFDPFDREDVEYAIQDSVALWYGIREVDKLLQTHFNVSIHDSPTLPGLAYRAFRQTMKEGEKYPGIGFGASFAARESYHGGQTIAFKTGLFEDVVSVDANSMYAYVMMNYPLPTGKVARKNGLPKDANPERTLCLAVVHIPSNVFPLLKTKDKFRNTGNFQGIVSGWYWLFELEKQRILGGSYTVVESYVWEESTDVCARFITQTHDLRMADYFGPIGAIAKLLGNSLYGKFAQMVAEWILYLAKEKPDGGFPAYDPKMQKVSGVLWNIPSKPSYRADMTHWASYITARARMVLNEGIEKVGYNDVIYCDTDSIFLPREKTYSVSSILGTEYGQFKIEKGTEEKGITFRAIAPKAYIMVEDDGKIKVKNKGVPSYSILESKRIDDTAEYIQMNGLSQILKKGKNYGRRASRKLAKETSTTNGKIENERWIPGKCEIRDLQNLRLDKPSLLLQRIYVRIIKEYQSLEG